jgi:hypothetical protein
MLIYKVGLHESSSVSAVLVADGKILGFRKPCIGVLRYWGSFRGGVGRQVSLMKGEGVFRASARYTE